MRAAFEREGDVRSVDLTGALAALWQERATGVLAFARGTDRVRFEILEGDLVGAFSSDPSFDAAEVLIRAGKLDPASLEGRRIPAGRDRALVARDLGVLTERDWRWGEKIRAVEIFADVITWLEGRYTFHRSERPEPGEFHLGIERLLLELFLRSRDREFVHRSLGAVDAPLLRVDDFEERFRALGLTAEADTVVAAIDGRATAAEISRRVGPDPFSVEKLLAALATLGLVHPEYAAPARPKRSAPGAPAPPPPPPAGPVEPEPKSVPEAPPSSVLPPEPQAAVPPTPPPMPPAPPPVAPTPEPIRPAPEDAPAPSEDLRLEGSPLELPLSPAPGPSEVEPALTSWEPIPPEPLDQTFTPTEFPGFTQSSRPGLSPIWLLLALAIAVAALLVLRSRHGGGGEPASAAGSAVATPATTPSPPAETHAPASASASAAAVKPPFTAPPSFTARPTKAPATPIPTRIATRAPAATTPTARVSAPATEEPVSRERRQWAVRAQGALQALRRDRRTRYAIQLELVCEVPSLEEAWRYDRGGALWLLAADHHGRECFRVLWGRYATLEQARAAKSSVPRFFFTPNNQPAVVSTRALLP
jgi:uncharacterized protein DUF4388